MPTHSVSKSKLGKQTEGVVSEFAYVLAFFSFLKMEAVRFSETSENVDLRAARRSGKVFKSYSVLLCSNFGRGTGYPH
jgi:hypothetical protein